MITAAVIKRLILEPLIQLLCFMSIPLWCVLYHFVFLIISRLAFVIQLHAATVSVKLLILFLIRKLCLMFCNELIDAYFLGCMNGLNCFTVIALYNFNCIHARLLRDF